MLKLAAGGRGGWNVVEQRGQGKKGREEEVEDRMIRSISNPCVDESNTESQRG